MVDDVIIKRKPFETIQSGDYWTTTNEPKGKKRAAVKGRSAWDMISKGISVFYKHQSSVQVAKKIEAFLGGGENSVSVGFLDGKFGSPYGGLIKLTKEEAGELGRWLVMASESYDEEKPAF